MMREEPKSQRIEPLNYSISEHLAYKEQMRERSKDQQDSQDGRNDGMELEEYYSTGDDDDDGDEDEDDDDNDDGIEDMIHDLGCDNEYDDIEENTMLRAARGRRRVGLVQKKIERQYMAQYGRNPTELELAEAMENIRLSDEARKVNEGERREEAAAADAAGLSQEDDEESSQSYYYTSDYYESSELEGDDDDDADDDDDDDDGEDEEEEDDDDDRDIEDDEDDDESESSLDGEDVDDDSDE